MSCNQKRPPPGLLQPQFPTLLHNPDGALAVIAALVIKLGGTVIVTPEDIASVGGCDLHEEFRVVDGSSRFTLRPGNSLSIN